VPNADEIKKKLVELRSRIEKTRESIEKVQETIPGYTPAKRKRKASGSGATKKK